MAQNNQSKNDFVALKYSVYCGLRNKAAYVHIWEAVTECFLIMLVKDSPHQHFKNM